MKKNTKKQDKICAILHSLSSILFLLSGVLCIVSKNNTQGITYFALSICFASLAVIYCKKYKSEK